MEGVQGAILRVKLRYLEAWTEARRAHAAAYNRLLAGTGLSLPVEAEGFRHVYHVYAVLAPHRRELMEWLGGQGVQTGIHYPYPVHLLPAYADLGYTAGQFPVSEEIAARELSLPMFPELTSGQIDKVAEAVTAFEFALLASTT
jgi:dTDP-4-amino-4,6-dideoxygalactose transaminase